MTTSWLARTRGRHGLTGFAALVLAAIASAVSAPVLAAMVYGSVAGCSGEIEVWSGQTRVAVVPVRNGAYQVVVPPGTYRVVCVASGSSRTIRSDPSPVRQNLSF